MTKIFHPSVTSNPSSNSMCEIPSLPILKKKNGRCISKFGSHTFTVIPRLIFAHPVNQKRHNNFPRVIKCFISSFPSTLWPVTVSLRVARLSLRVSPCSSSQTWAISFDRVNAAIIHACLSDLSSVASIAIRVWYGVRVQNSTGLIPARTALLYDVASQSGSAFFLLRHLPAHSCRQSTPIAKPVARHSQRVSMEAITP